MKINYVITNPEKAKAPNHTYDTVIDRIEGATTYLKVIGEGVPFPPKTSRRRLKKAN